jgi:hypothetical protein
MQLILQGFAINDKNHYDFHCILVLLEEGSWIILGALIVCTQNDAANGDH